MVGGKKMRTMFKTLVRHKTKDGLLQFLLSSVQL